MFTIFNWHVTVLHFVEKKTKPKQLQLSIIDTLHNFLDLKIIK